MAEPDLAAKFRAALRSVIGKDDPLSKLQLQSLRVTAKQIPDLLVGCTDGDLAALGAKRVWKLVSEAGPELLHLGSPSVVLPHSQPMTGEPDGTPNDL